MQGERTRCCSLALTVLLLLSASTATRAQDATTSPPLPPPGRLVDIGDLCRRNGFYAIQSRMAAQIERRSLKMKAHQTSREFSLDSRSFEEVRCVDRCSLLS